MTTECVLAFGGNAAASEQLFELAIEELQKARVNCHTFASLLRSAPMGVDAGSEFLNSAGLFDTTLSAPDLLQTIHQVETQLGRERSVRWGPRPIDIDVIFLGDQIIDTDLIVIPHPCAWYRSFVLTPLAEICPEWVHPVYGETVRQLKHQLDQRPLPIQIRNEHFDFPFEQAALEFDAGRDQPTFEFRPSTEGQDVFCRIVLQPQDARRRSQPRLERQKTIRCPLQTHDGPENFLQFLRDLEAAIVG